MVAGIVLIVIGVAAVVACRAYVEEPVMRNVGVVVGIVVALLGVWLFVTALAHHTAADTGVDIDGAPAVVQLA